MGSGTPQRLKNLHELAQSSGGPAAAPFPIIMGKRITRAEIIEGLWEGYRAQVAGQKAVESDFVGWPDMEALLKHIEEHGLPPKNS